MFTNSVVRNILLTSVWCFSNRYLTDYSAWSKCTEPPNIVEWNIILLSILIALSGLQLIICILKVAAELKRTLCGTYSVFVQVIKHLRFIYSASPCHCSFSNFSQLGTYPLLYATAYCFQRICTDHTFVCFDSSTNSLWYTEAGGCSLWPLRLGLRRNKSSQEINTDAKPITVTSAEVVEHLCSNIQFYRHSYYVWLSQQ